MSWLGRYYSVFLLVAIWELIARSPWSNPRIFPRLDQIWAALWTMVQTQVIFVHAEATLLRVLVGFALAVAGGILLGFAMARIRLLDALFEPLFSFGYPVPRIAIYPVFIVLLGIGHWSKIMLIFLECLYPITIHTYYGVRGVNRVYVWAAQNMGATRAQLLWKVMLPAALPEIISGLRIALPIALAIAIITEMIGSTEGLGWLITYAQGSLSRSQVFAGVVVIAVIGFVLDRLLATLRNRLVFWEKESISIS
jgi:NitT/TauT family transport system permease protein